MHIPNGVVPLIPERLSAYTASFSMTNLVRDIGRGQCQVDGLEANLDQNRMCGSCRRKLTNNFIPHETLVVQQVQPKREGTVKGLYTRGRKDSPGDFWCFPKVYPTMLSSHKTNELRGLYRRHGAATNPPRQGAIKEFVSESKVFFGQYLKELLAAAEVPEGDGQLAKDIRSLKETGTLEGHDIAFIKEWVMTFPPAKRNPKLVEVGRVEADASYLKRKYAMPDREVFPKHEKGNDLTREPVSKEPDARLIQGFDSRTNVVLGPWITRAQHVMSYLLSKRENLSFACGMTGDDIGDLFDRYSKQFKYFFTDDFTLYDTTFGVEFHYLIIDILKMLGVPEYALIVRRKQIRGWGRTVGGLRFKIDGTMKSGASDTCLSNSLINLLSHVYVLSKIFKKGMLPMSKEMAMAAMGDDNVFCLKELPNTQEIRQRMADLGLLSKVERKEFEELDFLNLIPMPTLGSRRWRAVLKPGRIMARVQASETRVKTFRSYQAGVALGLMQMAGELPILKPFLNKLARRDKAAAPIVERYYRRHLACDRNYRYDFAQVRDWFCRRYSITMSALTDLERNLEKFDFSGAFSSPTLDDIFAKDGVLK